MQITQEAFLYSLSYIIPYFICFLYLVKKSKSKSNYLFIMVAFVCLVLVHIRLDSVTSLLCFVLFLVYLVRESSVPINALYLSVLSVGIADVVRELVSKVYWQFGVQKWNVLLGGVDFLRAFYISVMAIALWSGLYFRTVKTKKTAVYSRDV